MGDKTKIEWTDSTWSPVTGCDYVSAGCANCYAARMSRRLATVPGPAGEKYSGVVDERGRWTGVVKTHPDVLDVPLKWTRPRRIFVCSMSDLFHEDVPDWFIARVFTVMATCPRHTFQVLTKRPERMAAWLTKVRPVDTEGRVMLERIPQAGEAPMPSWWTPWPLPGVWVGTSVENQAAAEERVPHLIRCPAAVRWVSAEPLLGPVDLSSWMVRGADVTDDLEDAPDGAVVDGMERHRERWVRRVGVDWVVAGGESGPNARPMHPDWARQLRDQCAEAEVAFMFKQWGEWAPSGQVAAAGPITSAITPDGRVAPFIREEMACVAPDVTAWEGLRRTGKKVSGRYLDGALHDGYPS